jgi:DNA-binding CsgD family transcriptional regulator
MRGEMVVTDQDLMTLDQIQRNQFYNECLIPIQMPWFAGIQFSAGPAMWALCLQRTAEQGPFATDDKRVLATLSARLTEAATLSTAVGRIALSSATSALDGVRQPALAVDRDGRVLNANAVAHTILGDDVFVRNRFLGFRDKEASRQLDAFVRRMRLVPDTSELPSESFVVQRQNQRPLIVSVLPVPGAARGPFLGARAILTLTSLEPKRGLDGQILMKAFGLTRAEARAALLVAEGSSPEQAANDLNISIETFRAQLKAVFAKTGTHRQNELAALLSRF